MESSNNYVVGDFPGSDIETDAEPQLPSPGSQSRPWTPRPRKVRQRQRPVLGLDELTFQQLMEALVSNKGLQEKAAEIERLKAQVLAQMAARRHHESNDSGSEDPMEVILAAGRHLQASGDSRAPTGIDLELEIETENEYVHDHAQEDPVIDEDDNVEEVGLDVDRSFSMILSPYQASALQLASWIAGIQREQVMERVQSGTVIIKDLALGHITGYVVAAFFGKFGKNVLCSTAGGLLLLKLAHSKGYININWKNVCDAVIEPEDVDWAAVDEVEAAQAQSQGETMTLYLMDSTTPKIKAGCSIAKKILAVGDWVRENKYLAAGFACGLAFRIIGSKH